MREKIKEGVGAIVGPMITKSWRKSLANAEKAAAKGDKEAAKDAKAWRLWIDMRGRHEAKEAAEKADVA